MTDAEFEAVLDRRVQSRLSSDRDYSFAENAEQQALAERKIELQEEHALLLAQPFCSQTRLWEIEAALEEVAEELLAA